MTNYNNLGLNQFLQPMSSPVSESSFVNAYSFDSNNERSAITNTYIQDQAVTNAKIVSLVADKITAGTVTVTLGVGGANVTIDGANNRIIVNDGTVNRVLIGYQSGGF
jgi:hypothetical protein